MAVPGAGEADTDGIAYGVDDQASVRSVEAAVAAFQRGEFVVVADSESRENEGDLIIAGTHATPSALNFMMSRGRGLICVAITADRAAQLKLPPMVSHNEDHLGTAFTVSVDGAACHGVTTGISASDRAQTVNLIVHGTAADLRRPGHMFPLIARHGGTLERQGHTEAAVDLARMAGVSPVAVLVEIIRDDGEMARLPDLQEFSRVHGLEFIRIEDIIRYRTCRDGRLVWIS